MSKQLGIGKSSGSRGLTSAEKVGRVRGSTSKPSNSGSTNLGADRPTESSKFNYDIESPTRTVTDQIRNMFGRDVKLSDIAAASGALDGSKIRFDAGNNFLEVSVSHPDVRVQDRTFYKTSTGITIENEVFIKKPGAPKGLATRAVERQVEFATKLGANTISLNAVGYYGSSKWNGYYTWPKNGFDAKLDDITDMLPRNLKGAKTLQDLFKTKEGEEWWKINGSSMFVQFDLSPNSASRKRLKKTIEEYRVKTK